MAAVQVPVRFRTAQGFQPAQPVNGVMGEIQQWGGGGWAVTPNHTTNLEPQIRAAILQQFLGGNLPVGQQIGIMPGQNFHIQQYIIYEVQRVGGMPLHQHQGPVFPPIVLPPLAGAGAAVGGAAAAGAGAGAGNVNMNGGRRIRRAQRKKSRKTRKIRKSRGQRA